LVVGAWSDIIDVTNFSADSLEKEFEWTIAFAILFPAFVVLNYILFYVEDQHLSDERKQKDLIEDNHVKICKLKLQTKVQNRFMIATSKAVANYQDSLRKTIERIKTNPDPAQVVTGELNPIEVAGSQLAQGLRLALEATLPSDAKTVVAHFVEESGRLYPIYSSNGISKGVVDEFHSAEPERFVIEDCRSSASYAAKHNVLVTDACTQTSHDDDHKSFRFIGASKQSGLIDKQKRTFKSLVSIPILLDPINKTKSVICVSADVKEAVSNGEFSWFVDRIREHIEPRFQLLHLQSELLLLTEKQINQAERKYQKQFEQLFKLEQEKQAREEKKLHTSIAKLKAECKSMSQDKDRHALNAVEVRDKLIKSQSLTQSQKQEISQLKQNLSTLKGQLTKLKKKDGS